MGVKYYTHLDGFISDFPTSDSEGHPSNSSIHNSIVFKRQNGGFCLLMEFIRYLQDITGFFNNKKLIIFLSLIVLSCYGTNSGGLKCRQNMSSSSGSCFTKAFQLQNFCRIIISTLNKAAILAMQKMNLSNTFFLIVCPFSRAVWFGSDQHFYTGEINSDFDIWFQCYACWMLKSFLGPLVSFSSSSSFIHSFYLASTKLYRASAKKLDSNASNSL